MFARFRLTVLFAAFALMTTASAPAQSPHTDAFGDPLPKDVRFRLGTARLRHEGEVYALAWMPDGKRVISAGGDGTARMWRVADSKELRRFKSTEGNLLALAITRDGRLLASGGSGSGIHIWETATGKEVHRIKDKFSMIRSLNFSADGKTLAVCGLATKVCLYAVESGEKLREFGGKEAIFASAAFSPDGKKLLAGGRKDVVCWDTATGAEARKLLTEEGPIFQLAFSTNGKRLAAVQGLGEGQVWLWSWPEAKRLHRLPPDGNSINAIAFSPDGKKLATAGDNGHGLRLWDVAGGKELHRLPALEESHTCRRLFPGWFVAGLGGRRWLRLTLGHAGGQGTTPANGGQPALYGRGFDTGRPKSADLGSQRPIEGLEHYGRPGDPGAGIVGSLLRSPADFARRQMVDCLHERRTCGLVGSPHRPPQAGTGRRTGRDWLCRLLSGKRPCGAG